MSFHLPAAARTERKLHSLGDLLDFRNDVVHPRDKPSGIETFVGLEHIERDTGIRLGSEQINLAEMTGRRARFYRGDIVYGYLRPYLNKVWRAEFDGLCSVDQYVFRVKPEVDPGYISYFLRSAVFLTTAPVSNTPGQLPRIRSGEIAETPILLPSLAEQRRIAAILEQIDDLRRKRKAFIANLQKFVLASFDNLSSSSAKKKGLTRRMCLKELAKRIQIGPFGSLLHKEDYVRDGIPLVNPIHIQSGCILDDRNYTVSIEKGAELHLYQLRVGDIVMGRRGEMGRCAIVQERQDGFICGTGSIAITPESQKVDTCYLFHALTSSYVKRKFEEASVGATMPNLNAGIVEVLEIEVPPLYLQRAFAARVADVEKLKAFNRAHLARLDALFASLQHRAFRGEL